MSKRKKQEMKDYLKKMGNPHRTLEKRKKDHHRIVIEEHPRRIPIFKRMKIFLDITSSMMLKKVEYVYIEKR